MATRKDGAKLDRSGLMKADDMATMLQQYERMAKGDFEFEMDTGLTEDDDADIAQQLAAMEAETKNSSGMPMQTSAVSGSASLDVETDLLGLLDEPPQRRARMEEGPRPTPAPEALALSAELTEASAAIEGKAQSAQTAGDAAKAAAFTRLAHGYRELAASLQACTMDLSEARSRKEQLFAQAKASLAASPAKPSASHVHAHAQSHTPVQASPAPSRRSSAAVSSTPVMSPPAVNRERESAYASLRQALVEYMNTRASQAKQLNQRRAEGKDALGVAELKRIEAQVKEIVGEVGQYKKILQSLDFYRIHPTQPPCPVWTFKLDTVFVETTDDTVPAGAMAVQITRAVHLKDKNGKAEKGDVTVKLQLPFPIEKPSGLTTDPPRKIDAEGNADIKYEATLGIGASARSAASKAMARVAEKKHVVVIIERRSAALLSFMANTAVIAKGALPLTALLQDTSVTTMIPLWSPECEVTDDGARSGANKLPIVPGTEGERGGLLVSLKVHAPLSGQPSKATERKQPVVTSWPPLPTDVPAAAPAIPSGAPVPSIGAGQSVATVTLASPAPAAAPAQPSGPTIVAGVNISDPNFRPDDVEFVKCSSNVLNMEITAAVEALTAADKAYNEAKKVAQAKAAAIADADARQEALDMALLPAAAKVKAAKTREKALRAAFDALSAAAGAGTLDAKSYTEGIATAIKRDKALRAALDAAGRKSEAAKIADRLKLLEDEHGALLSMPQQ